MALHPIETHYNGYRFRSRLEARWAVFFEAVGLKYRYEPEGYDLGALGWYLPDFWLPTLQTWIEIKPVAPSDDERMIAYAFATERLRYFLFTGPPWAFGVFYIDEMQEWGMDHAYFARCRRCDSGIYIVDDDAGGLLIRGCEPQCTSEKYPYVSSDITHAVCQAKGARFEHGEMPRSPQEIRRLRAEYDRLRATMPKAMH